MNISALIRELLFSHDCVIVPGFGAFIGNYIPARTDSSTDTFYPPCRKISFNRNLVHNDGLLTGRISEALKINYGDARTMVEEYAASLHRRIGKGERIAIDHIGVFTSNIEGSLEFEPDRDANYLLDSYGLSSFRMAPLSEYDVRKKVLPARTAKPERSMALRRNLWRAAVLVPLLSSIVYVSLKNDLFSSKTEESSLNPLVKEEFESNRMAIEKKSSELKDSESSAVTNTETSVSEAVTPSAVPSAGPYNIITGSFRSQANANAQARSLEELGFTPEISPAPNGFFRVSAMKCSDLVTAKAKKDSIGDSFPGSWIIKD